MMMRNLFDAAYYWTAMHMPLWWDWQFQFVMNARAYFEVREEGKSRLWKAGVGD